MTSLNTRRKCYIMTRKKGAPTKPESPDVSSGYSSTDENKDPNFVRGVKETQKVVYCKTSSRSSDRIRCLRSFLRLSLSEALTLIMNESESDSEIYVTKASNEEDESGYTPRNRYRFINLTNCSAGTLGSDEQNISVQLVGSDPTSRSTRQSQMFTERYLSTETFNPGEEISIVAHNVDFQSQIIAAEELTTDAQTFTGCSLQDNSLGVVFETENPMAASGRYQDCRLNVSNCEEDCPHISSPLSTDVSLICDDIDCVSNDGTFSPVTERYLEEFNTIVTFESPIKARKSLSIDFEAEHDMNSKPSDEFGNISFDFKDFDPLVSMSFFDSSLCFSSESATEISDIELLGNASDELFPFESIAVETDVNNNLSGVFLEDSPICSKRDSEILQYLDTWENDSLTSECLYDASTCMASRLTEEPRINDQISSIKSPNLVSDYTNYPNIPVEINQTHEEAVFESTDHVLAVLTPNSIVSSPTTQGTSLKRTKSNKLHDTKRPRHPAMELHPPRELLDHDYCQRIDRLARNSRRFNKNTNSCDLLTDPELSKVDVSSVLAQLLLTRETLDPNEGSEWFLARNDDEEHAEQRTIDPAPILSQPLKLSGSDCSGQNYSRATDTQDHIDASEELDLQEDILYLDCLALDAIDDLWMTDLME